MEVPHTTTVTSYRPVIFFVNIQKHLLVTWVQPFQIFPIALRGYFKFIGTVRCFFLTRNKGRDPWEKFQHIMFLVTLISSLVLFCKKGEDTNEGVPFRFPIERQTINYTLRTDEEDTQPYAYTQTHTHTLTYQFSVCRMASFN